MMIITAFLCLDIAYTYQNVREDVLDYSQANGFQYNHLVENEHWVSVDSLTIKIV